MPAPATESIIEVAEGLLSRRYGGSQRATDVEKLNGSGKATVLRVRLASSPFLQERDVVVKYIPDTGDELDDAALVREIVTYQFTTALPERARPGPVLLAHDLDDRILVVSDSGQGQSFSEILAGTDDEDFTTKRQTDERVQAIRNLGAALGRMHASTAGAKSSFDALRSRMQRKQERAAHLNNFRDKAMSFAIARGVELIKEAGFSVTGEVEEIARQAVAGMNGSMQALSTGDLAPDNILVVGRTQFLDYEWAGFRDVFFDLAVVISGFPGYLNTRLITDEEARVFVDAWAAEVHDVWPGVSDPGALQGFLTTALLGVSLFNVSEMVYGSAHNLVRAVATQAGETSLPINDEELVGVDELFGSGTASAPEEDVELMRRDLFESFESLSRYAAHCAGKNTGDRREKLSAVAELARAVLVRLAPEHRG